MKSTEYDMQNFNFSGLYSWWMLINRRLLGAAAKRFSGACGCHVHPVVEEGDSACALN